MSVDIDRRASEVNFAIPLDHEWVEDFAVKDLAGEFYNMIPATAEFVVVSQNGTNPTTWTSHVVKANGKIGWLVPKASVNTLGKGTWRYLLSVTVDGIKEPWLAGELLVDKKYSEQYVSNNGGREIKVGTTSGVILYAGVETSFGGELGLHLVDPTPHPAYDDTQDLSLLFENGLV